MTASRLSTGGSAIDRSCPLRFSFDGTSVDGFAGDTIASALLAGDVAVVGRSFKYHRPRGIWGAGVEEPNALVDIGGASPNTRATTEPAREGLVAKSVNATPNALSDRNAFLDRFSRFIPAAFYYKTFMWPDWHMFEPRIRAMAGLGKVDTDWTSQGTSDQINHHCDVLVVGAGPAGLAAARLADGAGLSVTLVDDQRKPGGSLGHRASEIDGRPAAVWIEETLAALVGGGHLILPSTTAFGIYDHNLVGLNQRHFDGRPDRLWRVRPRRIVLATGAIERPLPFANNDLPDILSADAALSYLRRHAVLAGRRIVVATNNDSAYEVAEAVADAGAEVTLVDIRRDDTPDAKVRTIKGRALASAAGKLRVEGVTLDDGTRLDADCVLVSGGWTPTIHLFGQARGKLAWSEARAAFLPGDPVDGIAVAGAAAGAVSLSDVFASSEKAVAAPGQQVVAAPRSTGPEAAAGIVAAWPLPGSKGRVWIDYQNDVTVKDVELAARENFVSVEHLKRYTTLGMATDQGKTSNLPGLALMAGITGRTVPEVGTTTYRPPFTPVPLASFAGARVGELMAPVRRLPLEKVHRASGAVFQEYGGWLRPAHYGGRGADADRAIQDEALRARQSVALFDGSTLGKIEVIGTKAAEFVDFLYYNTMSTLKPGRCRYGFMLSENGVVFDDGVLVRLDEHRFVVSCSSSHVAAVHARLEEWRQDRFGRNAVYIHNATSEMATLTVSGPNARKLLETVGFGLSLDDASLPHMAIGRGVYAGDEVRIARVSFTGDRSYEISIRADRAEPLWAHLRQAGLKFDAVLIGLEALMILRAEKGFIVIGKDTDGTTLPHDLGSEGPRAKRQTEYVGRRSLFTEEASRGDRLQLVGLTVPRGEAPLPTGAHGIKRRDGRLYSQGFVTSSYQSPTLGQPIALGLIERGAARHGETIEIQHLGKHRSATIAAPCAYDPAGDRLNA
ncbi:MULTISPECIES: sarcosine oxidase subunit alpha family protein [unclassified Mesorhizobium]|uniref:sarcosine oxidase subunit alpha family protein n=1 Tax=unclassified Mesorhizobium TaxID=325217 RepID=UPI001CCE9CB8|nr:MULTISPECIES: sarcosine oxidase subunit alpha family protein [unclassified Mesorhizobium]MBZ9743144.1 sarcosine oxidase subunit alpha family protein [Mesorhizobium sp. CO1-1-4]MBZ9801762.1 sarcosine oxidase subunit alpha family protein [Mesorhizobium sp. ES1-6]